MSASNINKSLLLPLVRALQTQEIQLKPRQAVSDEPVTNEFARSILSVNYIQEISEQGKLDNTYVFNLSNPESPESLQRAIESVRPYLISEIIDLSHSNSLRNKTKQHLVETLGSKVDPKVKKAKRSSSGRTRKRVPDKKKSTASTEPLKLLANINARLPQAVADNMGAPALVFRTGRFAQSVEALSAKTTKTGISINYRYQADPYQVFEMGLGRAPWATRERDPRKLIANTIRELAAELVTTKIFPRRVF